MKRWTEYCTELYNHPVTGDTTVLKVFNENQETPLPILRSEIETAVNSLKKGKSPGVDNIPAELILAGDNKVIDVLTTICNSIWKNGKWPTPWTQSLVPNHPTKERKSAVVSELPNHQPYKPSKQSHAESNPEQTKTSS